MDSNRGPYVYQPNALPLGQTGSRRVLDRRAGFDNFACSPQSKKENNNNYNNNNYKERFKGQGP